MYAYAGNNPINSIDPLGTDPSGGGGHSLVPALLGLLPLLAMALGPEGFLAAEGLEALGAAAEAAEAITAGSESAEALPTLANLGRQVAFEEAQSAFTDTGELTAETIANSRQIMTAEELNNPAIPDGFAKYASETFQSPSGDFQIHFYMNDAGEVYYGLDYKSVFTGIVGLWP